MSYSPVPDRRMAYDADGTVIGTNITPNVGFAAGITAWMSTADMLELNDQDSVTVASLSGGLKLWVWFPEVREIVGIAMQTYHTDGDAFQLQGSADSTNGLDGTWETATLPGGHPTQNTPTWAVDHWRTEILPVSFTTPMKVIRILNAGGTGIGHDPGYTSLLHLYGRKDAGETPDDILFIDHDDTPGVEFTTDEDFGDRPLGTTVVRQVRVKNASATLTANSINLQLNDTDFSFSFSSSGPWESVLNIASLGAGAESATIYVRNTTPDPLAGLLGPRAARIIGTVGSWT